MNAKAKIQAQLSAYLDGELDEAQLRQVEEALENDGELRAELADLAAARKLLRDLPAEKPPLDLVSRVLSEAERSQLVGTEDPESSLDATRWVHYAASAAVLLVAATVGMVIAFTICSPGLYKDNLAHHGTPDKRQDVRDDRTSVAIADGKRGVSGEDFDREKLGRLAIRDLPADGPAGDVRELKERGLDLTDGGGGGAGGHFINNGKLGTVDDNGRSSRLDGRSGPGGSSAGETIAIGNGSLTSGKGGEGNLSGSNTYTGISTVVAGTQTKSGAGTLIAGHTVTGNDGGALAKGVVEGDADPFSGPFDNVKSMSAVLAGNTTKNTIIYTDRLDLTQEQVEKVLVTNGIAAITTAQSEASAPVGKTAGQAPQARNNYYVANTLSPAQVQYEAYVTPEQLAKVQKDLDRLRARQNVSQDVPALVYNEANAKNRDDSYKKDQAGKDGYYAGKDSAKWAGVALARSEGDSGGAFRRKLEAESEAPVPKTIAPAVRASRPAPELAPAAPSAAAPEPAPEAKPVATAAPAQAAPVAEIPPPSPVVVATGVAQGEEAGRKAKNDARSPAKTEDQLAEAAEKDESQPGKALDKDKTQLAAASAKPAAKQAKAPDSGSGWATTAEPRGPSANEPIGIGGLKRLELSQTRPATPAEKSANEGVEVALTPSVGAKPSGDGRLSAPAWSTATKPGGPQAPNEAAKLGGPQMVATSGEKAEPNPAAKAGYPVDSEVRQISALATERLDGQAAGPVGGQRAGGIFNPPTAPPATAPTSAPAKMMQQQVVQASPDQRQSQSPITDHEELEGQAGQVVQVGVVRQSPVTQSGGTVNVRFATPPGQAGRINQIGRDLATANVQKLVITLNYRLPGEAGANVDLDRASRLRAAASQAAAPAQAPPAADRAAQEVNQQENQTQSK